jgi:hypothetical protein
MLPETTNLSDPFSLMYYFPNGFSLIEGGPLFNKVEFDSMDLAGQNSILTSLRGEVPNEKQGGNKKNKSKKNKKK